jgi:hypothetical protein
MTSKQQVIVPPTIQVMMTGASQSAPSDSGGGGKQHARGQAVSGRQSAATVSNCGSCKYLDVKPDSVGRVVPRKNCAYMCLAPDPEKPLVPASMRNYRLWQWPPPRTYMSPSDGEDCPAYKHRERSNGR